MTLRLRRLLIGCSLWLAGTALLAGPGLHLIAPCDPEGHHEHAERRGDESEPCAVCTLLQHLAAPAPVASASASAPVVERAPLPAPALPPIGPERPRLPRAPPVC